ncbi:MAG: homoserine dehydrogenase [Gemmatimonadaceae bacterium]
MSATRSLTPTTPRYARPTETVRIALAGCGTVGGALLDLIARHGGSIERRAGLRFEVVTILVRDRDVPPSLHVPRERLTDSVEEFLAVPADIVVEAIGGVTTAATIARATLARGQRLVTANKALLRVEGPALAALAHGHSSLGAAIDFEAAVGGGVPVVRALRESLTGHGVSRIRGVLNGTTNYILSRVEDGDDEATALRAAQRAGFAEADPSRDLSGLDAADKIAVLAWLAFGVDPTRLLVRTLGLPPDLAAAVRNARAKGRVLRLVAEVEEREGVVCASVAPVLLEANDPLARARDEENVVVIESESAGAITLHGRGAGGLATASALLADLLRASSPVLA